MNHCSVAKKTETQERKEKKKRNQRQPKPVKGQQRPLSPADENLKSFCGQTSQIITFLRVIYKDILPVRPNFQLLEPVGALLTFLKESVLPKK